MISFARAIGEPKAGMATRAPARLALVLALALACLPPTGAAQESEALPIDVQKYTIEADLDPATHQLKARAKIDFIPNEQLLNVTFELNGNLSPSNITDAKGEALSAQKQAHDGGIRVNFPQPLAKGQPVAVVFEYGGTLASAENQPVEGIKLGYIGPEVSYLLYPARWFPVSGYQVDRFAAELTVTVPQGMRVVAPGRGDFAASPAASGKSTFRFVNERADFPGSFAVVREQPQRITTGGAAVDVYFRGAEAGQAQTYGEAAGKIFGFYTTKFGPAAVTSLSLVEIDAGSVNGYAAPGIVFLSPQGIGGKLNYRLLSHEIAHQWWRGVVSPRTRAHLWLDEGMASYAELLYVEEIAGKAAVEQVADDFSITALAHDTVPIIRAASLPEYSPEFDSVVAKKGAMVMRMLRWVIGDDPFFQGLTRFLAAHAGQPVTTADLRQVFEQTSGRQLTGFFIQWLEANGAPEFAADYTVYRTQKGFKIAGKIKQDMDTFTMPVELRVDTDGEPEIKRVDVVGTASDFMVETFGRPRKVTVDPDNRVLKYNDRIRLLVATTRGQLFADMGEYEESLKEYQKALDINKNSSLAHFRIAEVFFAQGNYQSAANAFREALNGNQDPKWTEVWSHINLGKIFDITGQRQRALNEYRLAQRTRDNTQGAQEEAQRYQKEPYRRERQSAI